MHIRLEKNCNDKKIFEMKWKYFLFSFFSCPFSLFPSSIISLSYFTLSVILLSSVFIQKIASAFNINIDHIYEENMLTHQGSLKESICEKMFPITYTKLDMFKKQAGL